MRLFKCTGIYAKGLRTDDAGLERDLLSGCVHEERAGTHDLTRRASPQHKHIATTYFVKGRSFSLSSIPGVGIKPNSGNDRTEARQDSNAQSQIAG